ncbi:MAG: hypothetical protein CFE39_05320 [Comamonadaceae bacterium PBBC2]|nr:MAG: hypothetical protein CFE39_05320 [Comamonadaceae bacterium PBBC2]
MSYLFSFSKRSRWIAAAAVVAFSAIFLPNAGAQAVGSVQQDRQATLQASQARTPVPPVTYRSVFADLPQGVESTTLDWKAANANVGQFKRGYADLLKWEQEQAAKARTVPANTAPGAKTPTTTGEKP